ncbi:polysaccharide deacetylase family protein [Paenibacillus maysiensis]|uniref:polysaccharide deacetylase family protein n=1 Tax=Paenibacillus maysiensis TaxID=1155954 RepID=UPI0012DBF9EA
MLSSLDCRIGHNFFTFDDSPSEYTKQIVNILKDNEAAGTILFVGKQVRKHAEGLFMLPSKEWPLVT